MTDLLYEMGCEELPASFVDEALAALPRLTRDALAGLRLAHGDIRVLGTPRRLAVLVSDLQTAQDDLEEELVGPPTRIAFKDGAPTKAAQAFADKLGVAVTELTTKTTPKGDYLSGVRREAGRPAAEILPPVLATLTTSVPFRKSMRWGDGTLTFGRPLRWLLALLDDAVLPVAMERLEADRVTYGHRFLHPAPLSLDHATDYVDALRRARVFVDPDERASVMRERLAAASRDADGALIEDDFLVAENRSLVEDPQVVVGRFDPEFLALPEAVILEVARDHQRYFGLRDPATDALLPRYLAVVNTAEQPDRIAAGNDRVMRARLADAQFFHREDLKRPLADRRAELQGIVFQNRLGSVGDKVARLAHLVPALGALTGRTAETVATAAQGAALCKNDLVTWMVGEFPSLQGLVGRAYARASDGVPPDVADVIAEHYAPKGAADAVAPSDAGALVAIADRIDTLVGCFGIGLTPTGTTDPYGLRRACLGVLRTVLDRGFDLPLRDAIATAHAGYDEGTLDHDVAALEATLLPYVRDRLRGLLGADLPLDVVDASLAVAADRPGDARARARALATLDPETRQHLGEVFKRAHNIAREAPPGEPDAGDEPAERALFDAFVAVRGDLDRLRAEAAYAEAFARLAGLAAPLATYFDDVLVMHDDEAVRSRRLRLMRVISETCRALAHLERLGTG
ncbi:MAG: glycine--tRNA ligase subunit beta [Myxococcota bacterium]